MSQFLHVFPDISLMFSVLGFIQHFAGRILVLPSLELTMLLENFQIRIIYLLTALLGVSSLFLFRLFSINSELKTSLYQLNTMQQTKWQNTSLLAHDLRSPLQIIQLKAALLKQNIPDSRHLSDIEYAAERIHQMAARIAALQTENKLPDLTPNASVLHVQEALKTITRPYHDILAGKNIQLSLHLPQTPVYAQIDAPFLSESVENLLSNAIKHAPSGSVIDIAVSSNNGFTHITIQDQGPGFDLQKVLKNTPASAIRNPTGWGIGLNLLQKKLQQIGGTLISENTPNPGSSITLRIPMR